MNKEITELITNTLLLRDTKEQPLQEHELNLLKVLAVGDDTNTTINEHLTTILEPCLKRKVDGEKLARHELRVYWGCWRTRVSNQLIMANFYCLASPGPVHFKLHVSPRHECHGVLKRVVRLEVNVIVWR